MDSFWMSRKKCWRLLNWIRLLFRASSFQCGSYAGTQVESLCNHHRIDRSLRLMFSHYFIVIAVNLVTVAFKFLENSEADPMFTAILMCGAMALFYVSIFSDSVYCHERFGFGLKDMVEASAFVLIGGMVMLLLRGNIYGFLVGAMIVAGGNFVMLIKKYR